MHHSLQQMQFAAQRGPQLFTVPRMSSEHGTMNPGADTQDSNRYSRRPFVVTTSSQRTSDITTSRFAGGRHYQAPLKESVTSKDGNSMWDQEDIRNVSPFRGQSWYRQQKVHCHIAACLAASPSIRKRRWFRSKNLIISTCQSIIQESSSNSVHIWMAWIAQMTDEW